MRAFTARVGGAHTLLISHPVHAFCVIRFSTSIGKKIIAYN